jgi:eukaryotic-like serine/threonine-protein kinase
MAENVTLLRPDVSAPSSQRGLSSALPPDLLEQIRSRLRLLALFLVIGYAIDPVMYFANYGVAALGDFQLPSDFFKRMPFQWANLGAMTTSAVVWGLTRHPRLNPSRLLTLGLVYEVIICFVISFGTIWEHVMLRGFVPLMTWVPVVVILFPVLLPGPPRRMLIAAILSAAMMPLSLVLLHAWNLARPTADDYSDAVIQGAFSVMLAYMGARVVYGLGREVAKARELGSYRLEEKLGQGGMGEVWRARHRMLARPAAIKLIRRSPAGDSRTGISEDARRRFEREAQVIASLRSPHTVGLFDFGVAQDGTFYYAMELLDGIDTDTLVRRFGPVAPERVIYLLRQICHSLAEAELYGLVHRDIKPANIFLCRYGAEYDFVKVLDFGLVKTLDGGAPDTGPAPTLTRENVVQGTPAFMAPEQAMGVPLNGSADIYATGCVAYWLLTGQLVFTADTPMGFLIHHARTPPTPPSAVSEVPIPEALDRLVLSCLAKDPAERPQAAELSRQLAAVAGADTWTEERARDWWAKHLPALAQGRSAREGLAARP